MTTAPQTWPKRCNVCSTLYTREQWEQLKNLGTMDDGRGGDMELRDCPCGNTMSVPVVPVVVEPTKDEWERGEVWKKKSGCSGTAGAYSWGLVANRLRAEKAEAKAAKLSEQGQEALLLAKEHLRERDEARELAVEYRDQAHEFKGVIDEGVTGSPEGDMPLPWEGESP